MQMFSMHLQTVAEFAGLSQVVGAELRWEGDRA